jgi:hypothetical protein
MREKKITLIFILITFIGNSLIGQDIISDLYQVNKTNNNSIESPDMAMHPDGDYVIVWKSLSHDATSYNRFRSAIWGKQFDANGVKKQDDYQLPRYFIYAEAFNGNPSVVVKDKNEFTAFWETHFYSGVEATPSRKIVRKHNYDLNSPALNNYIPNDYDKRFQFVEDINWHKAGPFSYSPQVDITPYDEKKFSNYTYAWVKDSENGQSNIFVKYYAGRGVGFGISGTVNATDDIQGQYRNPRILKYGDLGTLNFILVFEKHVNNKWELHARRYSYSTADDKFNRGDELVVATQTYGISKYSASVRKTGEFAVAWSEQQDENNAVIYTKIYDVNDNPTNKKSVHNANGCRNINPSVTVNASGNFLYVWEKLTDQKAKKNKYNEELKTTNIFVREITVSGAKVSGKQRVIFGRYSEYNSTVSSANPIIKADKHGNYVVCWEDDGNVYAKQVKTGSKEAPEHLLISNSEVKENIKTEETIAQFLTIGENIYDDYTYSLVDGDGDENNDLFQIGGNKLRLKAGKNLDFETKTNYKIRVKSAENVENGNAIEKSFEITVSNVNEAPTDITLSSNSIAENSKDKIVATVLGADPDSKRLIYALVQGDGDDDNGAFVVENNILKVANGTVLNSQTKNQYKIRVGVSDAPFNPNYAFSTGPFGGREKIEREGKYFFFEKEFIIDITKAIDPSVILLSNNSIEENSANKDIGDLTTDVNNNGLYTFTIVNGEGDKDNVYFVIEGTTLKFKEEIVLNYEVKDNYHVRVAVGDADNVYAEKAFVINLKDVNETPTDIQLSNNEVEENSTEKLIGQLSNNDPENDDLTYTLVSGEGDNDNVSFELDGTNLKFKDGIKLDYEDKKVYKLRIAVGAGGDVYLEKALEIRVKNVNEAPTDITLSGDKQLNENSAKGTVIGKFSAVDVDAVDNFTYTVVSVLDKDGTAVTSASDYFAIGGADNRSLVSVKEFDYEINSEFTVVVRVSDNAGAEFTKNFVISIVNVNEKPTAIELSGSHNIDENLPTGTVVGDLSATDPDSNESFTFTISAVKSSNGSNLAAPTDYFNIGGSDKNRLVTSKQFDYEENDKYTVTIIAADRDGLLINKSFVIDINDVKEKVVSDIKSYASDIILYPNPVSDYLNIKTSGSYSGDIVYQITNISGKLISSGILVYGDFTIDTRNMLSGVYLLKISVNNETVVYRVVKK